MSTELLKVILGGKRLLFESDWSRNWRVITFFVPIPHPTQPWIAFNSAMNSRSGEIGRPNIDNVPREPNRHLGRHSGITVWLSTFLPYTSRILATYPLPEKMGPMWTSRRVTLKFVHIIHFLRLPPTPRSCRTHFVSYRTSYVIVCTKFVLQTRL